MQRIFLLMILSLPLFVNAQEDSTYKGIKFQQGLSWTEIKEKARSENKYIFIDCFATWCGPCKMMDRDIYTHWRIGDAVNDKFISVKVQMDTTVKDNASVKSWYEDAHHLKAFYKINAYPTYLFFSSDGALVHSEIGYQDLKAFLRLTEMARDPQKPLYYGLYQDYKNGKKDYKTLGQLSIFAKKLIGDEQWANAMAKDYKLNYLDKLDASALCTKESFDFIGQFPLLMNTKDKFFDLFYNEPTKVDSVFKYKGMAKRKIDAIITREELENKILSGNKPITSNINWKKLQSNIAKKYKKVDAKRLELDYQIKYYRSISPSWSLWAKYKDEKIKLYPPVPPYERDWQVAGDLNQWGAWDAFLNCSEVAVLKRALDWIDLAHKLIPNDVSYMDTKANLLYKLGRKEEALVLQKRALDLANDFVKREVEATYKKMLRGEPTWPQTVVQNK